VATNKENSSPEENKLNMVLIALFAAVTILWLLTWGGLFDFIEKPEDRGVFGDMFGSINALFSGFAFAGVVYAILLQRIELKLQREELKLTRKELEGQKFEFQEQNKTLKKQRFENTFFQMLSTHNEIVNSMLQSQRGGSERRGRQLLKIIADECVNYMNPALPWDKNRVLKAYGHVYKENQSYLGHFFRFLYRTIKFVDDSDVEDKRLYTDIVRAQLSNQELQILFYNCLSSNGSKFKSYVEKYALLDNLPIETIAYPQEMLVLYDVGAYGGVYPEVEE